MEFVAVASSSATTSEVWALFVDVENWPSLTRSMKRVQWLEPGGFRIDNTAQIKQPGILPTFWRVTEVCDGTSFTWSSRTTGVTTVATHRVEPTDGGARITLTVRQSGVFSGFVGMLLGRRTQRWISLEAQGFARASGGRADADLEPH